MFNLTYPLLVDSLLLQFMLPVTLINISPLVRVCKMIDIQECLFSFSSPETISENVQSSTLYTIGVCLVSSLQYLSVAGLVQFLHHYSLQLAGWLLTSYLLIVLIEGEPPWAQQRAYSTLKLEPHTQLTGVLCRT